MHSVVAVQSRGSSSSHLYRVGSMQRWAHSRESSSHMWITRDGEKILNKIGGNSNIVL